MIEGEIAHFDAQGALLSNFVDDLAGADLSQPEQKHFFLAEAVLFRLFRIYERLTRAAFLHHCVVDHTPAGNPVRSKLKCEDENIAEDILKAGNKFLDWGNINSTQRLAGFVFENGYPIRDFLSPIHSDLVDLQRFRNFVSHDSREAEEGFKKSRSSYLRVGTNVPSTVGELALYRKNARSDIVLRLLHQKVVTLSGILRAV